MLRHPVKTITILSILISALAFAAKAQTCASAPVGLVSWYAAENNALDSRSRNNGALQNGAIFAAGKVGQGFLIGAGSSGDNVRLASTGIFRNQSNAAIEAWIKPRGSNSTGGNHIFFEDVGVNPGTRFRVIYNATNGEINVNGRDSTGAVKTVSTAPGAASLNSWTHFAAIWESGVGIKIYINGALSATLNDPTITGFSADNAARVRIGAAGATDSVFGEFNGDIDELSIYNRSLSDAEIVAIHAAGTAGKCKLTATVAPGGQVGWWAGDGDTRDIAGTNNGTLQNGAGFAIGKVGQSFKFDGIDDFVSFGNGAGNLGTGDFSIELWLRTTDNALKGILHKRTACVGGNQNGIDIRLLPDGNLRFELLKIGAPDFVLSSTMPINNGSFHHILYRKQSGTIQMFINGVLNNSGTTANAYDLTSEAALEIGKSICTGVDGTGFLNGEMDEVSLYNRALTDAEIQSVVNAGIAGKLKQNAAVDTNSLVSLWQGENNANDARGANNGTFPANTYTAGRVGQTFQTNSGFVSVPDSASLDFTNAYTIEMWVSPLTQGQPDGTTFFACKGNCFFANSQPYSVGFLDTRRVFLTVGNSSTVDRVISNSALPLNTFSHVAGTYDGTTMRIYINGVLDNSKTTSIGTLVNTSDPFIFGGSNISSTSGLFDEVALYNRALSAAEVRANYESGNALSTVVRDARTTFPSVTTTGTTQQIPLKTSDFPALTMGTHTGLIYDIDTSAVFTGNPTVCFNLPSFTPAQFSNLRVMHFENNNWVDVTAAGNTFPTLCTIPISSFSPFAIVILTPTAAEVSVSGRVLTALRRGIPGARVSIIDAYGSMRTVLTNSSGHYYFGGVRAGETYILTVSHKRYRFANNPVVQFINEDLSDFNFISSP